MHLSIWFWRGLRVVSVLLSLTFAVDFFYELAATGNANGRVCFRVVWHALAAWGCSGVISLYGPRGE